MKDTSFNSNFSFKAQGILREFNRPLIMGIINATPDSFYAESRVDSTKKGITQTLSMIEDGADIIDIGG